MQQLPYCATTFYSKLVVILVLMLGLSNCSYQNTNKRLATESLPEISRIIEGPLNDEVARHILNLSDNYKELILTSPGGYPSQSILIANKIIEKKYKISIYKLCVSACAEYLLPAANAVQPYAKVTFIDDPIIGFHWSAMLTEHIMKENLPKTISQCSYQDSADLIFLQKKSRINSDNWKNTLRYLGENKSEYRLNAEGCPEIKIKFENEYWLPTSKQLRDMYWLKFEGGVCADDLNTCSHKIDQIWEKGKQLMVGDEVYVSKGTQPLK